MEANNTLSEKQCVLCQNFFQPHPKVKDRQRVCRREDCQRLRQKLNQRDWLRRNPVDYKIWNQDYGQAWRRQHPDYWRQYRRKKRTKPCATLGSQLLLDALLPVYPHAKKEQLTATKSENKVENTAAKKEQLTDNFYLLKAKDLVFWPLDAAKKEQLARCFNCN
jgi:hypothetical protein